MVFNLILKEVGELIKRLYPVISIIILALFISTTTFAYTDTGIVLKRWYQTVFRIATAEVELAINELESQATMRLNEQGMMYPTIGTDLERVGIDTARHASNEINRYAGYYVAQVNEATKTLVGSSNIKGKIAIDFETIISNKSKKFKKDFDDQVSQFVDRVLLDIERGQDYH